MTRYYTKDHEWIEVDGDSGVVGITHFAQGQLGDITFVELPEPGQQIGQGDAVAVVDSVKAASDIYSPVSGTVSRVNQALANAPELVNSDAEKGGWLYQMALTAAGELDGLMDRPAYETYIAGL